MADEVAGIEKVERALGRWSPNDLAYIESVKLEGQDHGGSLTIVALFQVRSLNKPWPNVKGPMRRVTLCFQAVAELHLTGFGGAWVQVMGFDIIPMADRGWEDVRFQVEDYENGCIGFYCRSVGIVDVEDRDYYLP